MKIISLNDYKESRGLDTYYREPIMSEMVQKEPKKTSKPRKKRESIGGLQYYSQSDEWRANNVRLNPNTLESYSYSWWRMSEKFGRTVVLNSYYYSSMTCKHQWKMRSFFSAKGIEYVELEAPQGLQALENAIDHYERKIQLLNNAIATPRSHKKKNAERLVEIEKHQDKIKLINRLKKIRAKAVAS